MIRRCRGVLSGWLRQWGDAHPVSHRERWLAMIGGTLGIVGVYGVSVLMMGETAALLLIPSIGASAVLLFAVPHSPLGHPWNLLGGHLLSALVGVVCVQLIPWVAVAAAVSVGGAIGVMYYARCIHPPGGATALAVVLGGASFQQLGFEYLLTPVLLNAITLLGVAQLFNHLTARTGAADVPAEAAAAPPPSIPVVYPPIAHEHLVYALSELDSYIDISEEDLLLIYRIATGHQGVDPLGVSPDSDTAAAHDHLRTGR